MTFTIRHLLGIFLVAVSLLLFFMELNGGNSNSITHPYLLIFGFLTFSVYCFKFYVFDYKFISSSFYQIFYYYGLLISTAFVSSGANMYEINKYGTANGSYWLTIIFAVLGLESAYIGYKSQSAFACTVSQKKTNHIFMNVLVYGTLIASFLILLIYGSPLKHEVTRVKYWGAIAPSYLSPIRIIIFTSFLLVVVNFYQKSKARFNTFIARTIVLLYIAIAVFLLGEKFSAGIIFIFIWLIVKSSVSSTNEFNSTFAKVLASLLFALAYVVFTYNNMGIGYEFIIARIPLQGQILWSTLSEDFETIVFGSDSVLNQWIFQDIDIRKVIEMRYLPATTYELNQDSGTSLSGFFPTIPILLLGLPFSGVVHVVFSIFLGRIQSQLIQSVRNYDYIAAFLKFNIYFFLISIWYIGNINTFKIVAASYIVHFGYRNINKYLFLKKKVYYV